MSESRNLKLREVQALLNNLLEEEVLEPGNSMPSHWELPILPPPDLEGGLSSTDLLNWWFRAPQSRSKVFDEYVKPVGGDSFKTESGTTGKKVAQGAIEPAGPEPAYDGWTELSILFPEPDEHLAEEHAQAAVDCFYDFLHAVGQRDVEAAVGMIDDFYHTIEQDEEVDKQKFRIRLEAQMDALRNWDFEVSLAVAPEPLNHPYGVLIHGIVQFDAVNRLDGSKNGHVEHRVAILRQDESGTWRIAALPRVG